MKGDLWEALTFGLTCIVVLLQAWNLYILAKVKLWVIEKFVTKEDYGKFRDDTQKELSYQRVRRTH